MMRSVERRGVGFGLFILCGALLIAGSAMAGAEPDEKKEPAQKQQSSESAKKPAANEKAEPAPSPVQSPYEAAARAARERREADKSKAIVITNEDLGSAAGEIPPSPATPVTDSAKPAVAQTPTQSATEWMQQRQADGATRQEAIAEAEARAQAARQRVADLEQQLLAIKNPFAARPKLSDEEKTARQADTSTSDRLQRTQTQLEEARKELTEAEDQLSRARRRS